MSAHRFRAGDAVQYCSEPERVRVVAVDSDTVYLSNAKLIDAEFWSDLIVVERASDERHRLALELSDRGVRRLQSAVARNLAACINPTKGGADAPDRP